MDETVAAWLAAAEGADEAFVDDLWRRVLRRPATAEERERALAELRLGVSRAELLYRLVTAPEFTSVRLLDDVIAWAAAERRTGSRPRGLRAPGDAGPQAIAIPWCLARYGGERRLLVLDDGTEPAFRAAVAGLVGERVERDAELVLALATFDPADTAGKLARGGRILCAVEPAAHDWAAAGLLVYEEERYARGERGWGAVADGGELLCAELRENGLVNRVRRAVRR